jgi:hypothetical protein
MILDMRHRNRADVTVDIRKSAGIEILEGVDIESRHERYGYGKVHLSREQVRHLAARFTQLDVAFGEHAHPTAQSLTTTMMPHCGAEAFPVTELIGDEVNLVGVKVQVEGDGSAYLMPDQLAPVRHELDHISRQYLGHGAWGGEDARDQ